MLKIMSAANGESLNEEHISFQVEVDCDIGNYVLINNSYELNDIKVRQPHAYFFPQAEVKKGDFVVLWTK
jgi:hypothetical protein